MRHQKIDDSAPVWIVTRGCDGRLQDELDRGFLAMLTESESTEDLANALVITAGEIEIADTRLW